eukprot:scaffold74997_cov31-Tisochrysis_lutea.AAC.3
MLLVAPSISISTPEAYASCAACGLRLHPSLRARRRHDDWINEMHTAHSFVCANQDEAAAQFIRRSDCPRKSEGKANRVEG